MATREQLEKFMQENEDIFVIKLWRDEIKYSDFSMDHYRRLVLTYKNEVSSILAFKFKDVEYYDARDNFQKKYSKFDSYVATVIDSIIENSKVPLPPKSFMPCKTYIGYEDRKERKDSCELDRRYKYRQKLWTDAISNWYNKNQDFPEYISINIDWYDTSKNLVKVWNAKASKKDTIIKEII